MFSGLEAGVTLGEIGGYGKEVHCFFDKEGTTRVEGYHQEAQ
jgi:hypothetical protein